jgi:hypothetical protein
MEKTSLPKVVIFWLPQPKISHEFITVLRSYEAQNPNSFLDLVF